MELTETFPAHIKPVHVGVYKVSAPNDDYVVNFSYWNGSRWCRVAISAKAAESERRVSLGQNRKWKGVIRAD